MSPRFVQSGWCRAAGGFVVAALVALAGGCGGGGGGGGGAPAPTLAITASASTTQAGGAPVTLAAAVTNSSGPVSWTLTGPGSLSASQGATVTYAPPLPEDLAADGTAEIRATLGSIQQSLSIAVGTSPGHHWGVALYPKPPWRSATFANGLYVIGGGSGTVLRSTDAIQWTSSYVGLANDVRAIAGGASGFVAVGPGGLLARSSDAQSWTMAEPVGTAFSTPDFTDVAFGAGRYVAVAIGGIYHSVDGLHWTLANTGSASFFAKVAFGGGRFVAAVSAAGEGILYSDDGITWSDSNCGCAGTQGLAWGNGMFVALPGTGGSAVSSDGKVWAAAGGGVFGGSLTFARGQFIAVSGIDVYASTDASLWTLAYTRPGSSPDPLMAVAGGPASYVLVGFGGQMLRGPDLATWTPVSSDLPYRLAACDYFNGVYVAVGDGGSLFRSTDAVHWTRASTPLTASIRALTHDNAKFIALSFDTVFTSVDGDTWTAVPLNLGFGAGLSSIAYGNGRYVAVGGPDLVMTSTNATQWSQVASGLPFSQSALAAWVGVAYGNGKFVAIAYDGTTTSSTDGLAWTPGPPAGGTSFQALTYGTGAGYVAVAFGGNIRQSSDGITWNQATTPSTDDLYGVAYGNREYVAVGASGALLTSHDGLHWNARSSGVGQYLYGVGFGNGTFLAVGSDGSIITSSR